MTHRDALFWGGSIVAALLALPVSAQHRPLATSKLAPVLQASAGRLAAASRQMVRVQVRDAAAFRQWARQELPKVIVQAETGQPQLLQMIVDSAQLAQVLASPLVLFVDAPNRPAHDERQLNQADLTVNSVTPVHRRYPGLAGQGLTVSVKENPLDVADIDFKGRLVYVDPAQVMVSSHATTMATLIAGGGNSAPAGRGVAWQASITSSDYARLLPDNGSELQQRNVSVQNHSYGTGIENYYGLEAQAYDAQARQYPTLLHVFSSGNSGNQASPTGLYQGLPNVANLTGQFKMSKNTLSVGATDALGQVAALSSRGPAYDGRVKPELVAFGDGGSSDAAALVSGMALLVQQAYRDQNSGALPPSALVKAALLNSADDIGRPEVDFVSGFGQADALGAVRTVLQRRYFQGSIGQGQATQFALVVPAGTQQLKLTLTWTDPAALASAAGALVNDLDVLLTSNGTSWRPWTLSSYPHPDSLRLPARRRSDHLNNVEQITLAAPAPGTYLIAVRGYTVASGTQDFSVAYELNSGFEWRTPATIRNVRPGATTQLRWDWAGPSVAGQLEYRPVGSPQWRRISTADLAARTYSWAAPDTTTLAQLRMVSGAGTFVSDTFALAQPLPLSIGYTCPDEALLYWRRAPSATQYQVYRLGATHLEPVQLTSDTTYVVAGRALSMPQYAVAPVFQGKEAERGSTVDLTTAGFNCYIRSFVARQPVADTVQLQVELGSTFRLQSVKLQRQEQGSFRTIRTLSPVSQLAFTLTDATAQPGYNQYRLELQDTGGRVFHSQLESIYQVSPANVLVFPVPVQAGAVLSIIGPPAAVLHLRLFDSLGRFLHESTLTGAINQLPTDGLKPGTYLLRISTSTGTETTRRIVVL